MAERDDDTTLLLLDCVEKLISGPTPSPSALSSTEAALERVCSVGGTDADRSAAEYARFVCALSRAVVGDVAGADRHLAVIGLWYRLSRAVWEALASRVGECAAVPGGAAGGAAVLSAATDADAGAARVPASLRVFTDALPSELVSRLCAGFSPASEYWAETRYDADSTGFFSWCYRLDQPPRNLVDSAVQRLRHRLRGVPEVDAAVCVEWWAHRRRTGGSWLAGCHQLHFDTDEATFQQGSRVGLRHPLLSSVLYLSASGGPTLVTDKRPGTQGLGTCGALVWPELGRLAMFSGDALHGVLPRVCTQQPRPGEPDDGDDDDRLTLIVAWWGEGAAPRRHPGGIGPLQETPDPSKGWQAGDLRAVAATDDEGDCDDGGTRVQLVFGRADGPDAPLVRSGAAQVQLVSPLWEAVEGHDGSTDAGRASGAADRDDERQSLPPLRYFLPGEDEIELIYKRASVEMYWEQALTVGSREAQDGGACGGARQGPGSS